MMVHSTPGIADDINERLQRHNSGRGAEYTRLRLPVKLIYFEEFQNKEKALIREKQIKDFSRKNKQYLIQNGCGKRYS